MSQQHEPAGPGEEVRADDPGVPNDPPGPDVPQETTGAHAPDVPGHPTGDRPEGVQQDSEDGENSKEGIAQVGDVEGTESEGGSNGTGEGSGEGPADVGAPTKPAEPAG